jgi:hypothetical protein
VPLARLRGLDGYLLADATLSARAGAHGPAPRRPPSLGASALEEDGQGGREPVQDASRSGGEVGGCDRLAKTLTPPQVIRAALARSR